MWFLCLRTSSYWGGINNTNAFFETIIEIATWVRMMQNNLVKSPACWMLQIRVSVPLNSCQSEEGGRKNSSGTTVSAKNTSTAVMLVNLLFQDNRVVAIMKVSPSVVWATFSQPQCESSIIRGWSALPVKNVCVLNFIFNICLRDSDKMGDFLSSGLLSQSWIMLKPRTGTSIQISQMNAKNRVITATTIIARVCINRKWLSEVNVRYYQPEIVGRHIRQHLNY